MKKLTIEKEEWVAEIIDRMIAQADNEVTLVIPKGSVLGRSVKNFHLLKREADEAGKTIAVESVDENILAFAKEGDLEASHPLWRGVRGTGGIADIIPAGEESPAPKGRKRKTGAVKLTVHPEADEDAAEIAFRTEEEEYRPEPEKEDEGEDEGSRGSRRWIWITAAAAVIVLAVLAIVTWGFGHVTVTINFQKTPWTYADDFAADKSVSTVSAGKNVIPAQLFTTNKNITQTFPASGSANVSLKAQGTLTVYNAYSSAEQDLVATTRFVTPDGKIFRLVSNIKVPGEAVTNGQIVPSSVQAAVVADHPGPAYNEGAVAKLTVPGFQGSPKYDGFYGALPNGTSGGFIGTKAVPTATDITNAKAKVTAVLQANLTSDLTTSYPNNFKILTGATNVAMTKLTVSTTTDSNGNFSVFGEATLQAIGFDETAFKTFLLSLAQGQDQNSTFTALTLNYSNVQADFTKGRVSFALSATGTLEPAYSPDDFKTSIAGHSIGTARAAIAALPGLADGRISAWPMWLWSIPGNPGKIQVNAN